MERLPHEYWESLRAALQDHLGLVRSRRWLPHMIAVPGQESNVLVLRAPHGRAANSARKHESLIRDFWQKLSPDHQASTLTIRIEDCPPAVQKALPTGQTSRYSRSIAGYTPNHSASLNPALSLQRFAAFGNDLALQFCKSVSAEPGGDFDPLILYGESGSGKTHLLNGVGLRHKQHFPERKTVFVTVEALANHFGMATQQHTNDEFRLRYRQAELLIIDDLQGLGTKSALQIELIHLLDFRRAHKLQTVAAASISPAMMTNLNDALRSRLIAGVCVEIKDIDHENRIAALKMLQQAASVKVSDAVLRYLVKRVDGSMGDMIAAWNQLLTYAQLVKRKVDVSMARNALNEILGAKEQQLTPVNIAQQVATALNLNTEALLSSSRKPETVRARQLAMALSRFLTSATLNEIGEAYGGRSSGSVTFSIKRVRQNLNKDRELFDTARCIVENHGFSTTDLAELFVGCAKS